MSSILDALKKIEAEKAARLSREREQDEEFRPEAAAADLIGAPPRPKRTQAKVSPLLLLVGGALVASLLALIVTVIVLLASPSGAPQQQTAMNVPQATPGPPVSQEASAEANLPPSGNEAEPEVAALTEPGSPTQDTASKQAPVNAEPSVSQPMTTSPNSDRSAASRTLPEADVRAIQVASVAPIPEAAGVGTWAASPAPGDLPKKTIDAPELPENIKTLPILRSSDRARHGLDNLMINALREADENRPHGLAIINLNKIYIGEMIPGTKARLREVKLHGIAIEIVGAGKLFYLDRYSRYK